VGVPLVRYRNTRRDAARLPGHPDDAKRRPRRCRWVGSAKDHMKPFHRMCQSNTGQILVGLIAAACLCPVAAFAEAPATIPLKGLAPDSRLAGLGRFDHGTSETTGVPLAPIQIQEGVNPKLR